MEQPFGLKGKQVLVTGASSGIGRAIAIHSSKQGADIHLTARDVNRLHETKSMLSGDGNHCEYSVDLKDDAALGVLAESVPELDGIVLNAGAVKLAPVKFIKRDSIEELFQVNVYSSMLLVQRLLRQKKLRDKSSICFISSIASRYVTLGNAVYSATKGAINSFTRSLALELAPKQIRVNAILPGFVETNILDKGALNLEQIAEHVKNYPLGRFGKPEDVAYLAVYLLSDASAWMTGSSLTIDGGYSVK